MEEASGDVVLMDGALLVCLREAVFEMVFGSLECSRRNHNATPLKEVGTRLSTTGRPNRKMPKFTVVSPSQEAESNAAPCNGTWSSRIRAVLLIAVRQ